MRYFFGLPLPHNLATEVEALAQVWPLDRWPVHFRTNVEPHVTVKAPFNDARETWLAQLRTITNQTQPLVISLGPVNFFTVKVIHLEVGSPELLKLQQSIVQLFPASQLTARERGPYLPHLTLAISNRRLTGGEQTEVAAWLSGRLNARNFTATSLHIYRQEPGQTYEIASELPFSGNW